MVFYFVKLFLPFILINNIMPYAPSKHICNSHEPTHDQKLQKSLLPQGTDRQWIIKHRHTTSYIKHLAVSALSSVSARIKSSCNLTGKCFEMPNVSYT